MYTRDKDSDEMHPAKGNILVLDEDYPEYKIYLAIHEEGLLPQILEKEGSYSPDKRIAAIPFSCGTYERSGYLFRWLDGGGPDDFVTFGHYPDKPLWLNNRYVAVETMMGFGIYDLAAYPSTEKDAVFYVEYNDPAGPYISNDCPATHAAMLANREKFDNYRKELTIPTDGGGTFIMHERSTMREKFDSRWPVLHFQYDKSGKLRVTYSLRGPAREGK